MSLGLFTRRGIFVLSTSRAFTTVPRLGARLPSAVPATPEKPVSPLVTKTPARALASKADESGNEDYPSSLDEMDIDAPDFQSPKSSVPVPASASNGVLATQLADSPPSTGSFADWSKSYFGLSVEPFSPEIAQILCAPLEPEDIELKPDGLLYLPEIKYRRILNKAFGPGGWGLAPRSETNVGPKIVSREYALVCLGRLVAVARGEQEYFDPNGIPTATEGCKSNALMRCCKDLGIASELWDPRFIREFKAKYCVEVFVEHIPTKRKRKLWRRKDAKFDYPYKE